MALLLVLFVVGAAFVLGSSYIQRASVRMVASDNWVSAAEARLLAESALQHALYVLYTEPERLVAARQDSPLGPYSLGEGTYSLFCSPPAGEVYRLTGRGERGGVRQTAGLTVRMQNVYAAQILSSSPEAYWRLGETGGTRVQDERRTHDGWYVGGPVLGQEGALIGGGDESVDFDGLNDRAEMGRIRLDGPALTMVAWVKPGPGSLDNRFIVSKAQGDQADDHIWSLGAAEAGGQARLCFLLKTTGATRRLVATSGELRPGVWAHAAAVYDGTAMILYQDGAEVGRVSMTGSIDRHNTVYTWIGGTPPSAGTGHWRGLIDEVALFDRALTAQQVEALCKARKPTLEVLRWND